MKNDDVKKQLSTETMSAWEALTFAVVREGGKLKYKRVRGGIPRFGTDKFNGNRSKNVGPSKAG